MKFSVLADFFEQLDSTSSRLELIKILAALFKKVSPEEIDKTTYLLQGRVVPFFEPIEIGMADKLVEQAIALAFKEDREKVRKLISQLGDHGLAAEKLSREHHQEKEDLTVAAVYSALYQIATTGGVGSVEKKIATLAHLLQNLESKGAKYLLRITLAKLRLGIGDPTILDAMSLSREGDKSGRVPLEEAYNKTSDLGYVAKTYWEEGLEAIGKIHLQVGKPVRPALAERLPNAEEVIKRVGDTFAAEPKYDGFRTQVHVDRKAKDPTKRIQIFSRNLENMTHMFPDLINSIDKEVKADRAIFEGEALAYNPITEEFLPFQETTKRRRKYDIEAFSTKLPLKMFAFDLLYVQDKDITGLPYTQRRKLMEKLIPMGNDLLVAREQILHSADDIRKMFDEQITAGLEGVMIKKLDAPYKAGGRGYNWIKFKRMASGELNDTVDCVLLGVYTGSGKRTDFGVGGLLVGLYDSDKDEFVTVTRIGTGLTDEEFRKVNDIAQKIKVDHKPARVNALIEPDLWVEPKEVIEVFADEITKSPKHTAGMDGGETGYALRFPRLVSFRGKDKRAEDATTVKELIKMYENQKKVKLT